MKPKDMDQMDKEQFLKEMANAKLEARPGTHYRDEKQICTYNRLAYDRLVNANAKLIYLPITKGGKTSEYAPVSERIKAFRYMFPNGSITTKIIAQTDTDITVKAEVFDDEGNLLATGHASENRNIGMVNKTSMLENAETGAVGRALGFLGIGVKDSIATAEGAQRAQDFREDTNHLQRCHRCGREIIDTADKTGKIWSARDIASITLKAYGDTYCLPCVAEIKNTKTEVEP